jgi:hypothetical protein
MWRGCSTDKPRFFARSQKRFARGLGLALVLGDSDLWKTGATEARAGDRSAKEISLFSFDTENVRSGPHERQD